MMSMAQRIIQRKQSMWNLQNSVISTIAFGNPTQQNSVEFMNALNATLNYQKLELDILNKQQPDTSVNVKGYHNWYMLE